MVATDFGATTLCKVIRHTVTRAQVVTGSAIKSYARAFYREMQSCWGDASRGLGFYRKAIVLVENTRGEKMMSYVHDWVE